MARCTRFPGLLYGDSLPVGSVTWVSAVSSG
jgi:hypothetical protein